MAKLLKKPAPGPWKDPDLDVSALGKLIATSYNGIETVYPLPKPNEKWGLWLEHADPITDGNDCGPGRYHIMRKLSAQYAPTNWWPWYAEGKGLAGESAEKFGVHKIRIRRVNDKTFWRMIRLGWCVGANLSGTNLSEANLYRANLS